MAFHCGDIAEDNKSLGYEINEFLYDGKVKNKVFKKHSEKEYRDFIEHIRQKMFDSYNSAADYYGW